jgi:hypothetical protein
MRIRYIIAIVLLISSLSACSSATQSPLLIKTPQSVIEVTFTKLTATSTSEPEKSPSFTATVNVNMGTPIPDWEGIPVMAGAIKGEIVEFGYIYWINTTDEEVEVFYKERMITNGWSSYNRQTNVISWYGHATVLQFRQEHSNEIVEIMLVNNTEDNSVMVVIKKYIYLP